MWFCASGVHVGQAEGEGKLDVGAEAGNVDARSVKAVNSHETGHMTSRVPNLQNKPR